MKKKLFLFSAGLFLLAGTHVANAQNGASLKFDGVDDYAMTSTNITHGNHFTYEAWVNPTLSNAWAGIMTTSSLGGQQQWIQIALNSSGALRVEIVDDAGNNKWYDGNTSLLGAWHHIAITFDGTNLLFYVDGNVETTSINNNGTLGTMTINAQLNIGTERNHNVFYNGSIDEARVWGAARSMAQIQAYMNCAVTDTATGLIAYYSFNDGIPSGANASVSIVYDVAGNKLNATLNNFALSGSSSNFVTDLKSDYLGLQSSIGSTNCNNTLAAAIAEDFTGDGAKDVIVLDWNGATRMYINDGKGNFSNTYVTLIPSNGGNYDAADIDNDGDMDFVMASNTVVTAYINNGFGTFSTIPTNLFMGTGSAGVVKIADINGDGKKDVIVGNEGSGITDSSRVWKNTGTTGNASFVYYRGLAPSPARTSIAVGDINGDGFIDIVTGGISWSAQVFHNNSNNSTFTQVSSPPGYGGGVKLIDWNHDGKLDYMNYDNYNTYGLRYILNDGSGVFTATPTLLLQSPPSSICNLVDLNGDGFLDAVLNSWGGNGIVYISNGCTLTKQTNCNYTLGRADNNVTLADFNGDGTQDVFCQARCNYSSFYMNYLNTVTNPALPAVTVNSGVINAGSSFTMAPTGGVSYSYTPSGPIVNPINTSTYSVVGSNSLGCLSSAAISTVSVNAAALNFDGTNDIVNCGTGISSALANSQVLTLEAWVRPTSSVSTGAIISNHSSGTQFSLRRTSSNNYEFFIGFGTHSIATAAGTSTLNVWQHVAAVFNKTTMSIYINGVLSTSTVIPTYALVSSIPAVQIGNNGYGEAFNGDIDEVRVWKRALCQGEIQNNKNGEIATTGANLIANYHFNQGISAIANPTVTSLTDASGNANTGTLTGFALTGMVSNWVSPGAVINGSTVTAFLSPTLAITGVSAICASSSTTLTANGNVSTYAWTSGPATATNVVSPTGNTTYSVVGTNSLGCLSNMAIKTVTVNALPTVSVNVSNPLCNGGKGSATVTATGGASPYSYLASNGSTVSAQSNLLSGSYTYTVTDNKGCVKTQGLTVATAPSAIVTNSAVINALCNGGTGSATVTATGGISPYMYMASNGATVSAQSNLMAGTYNYTVTDANACTKTQVLTITAPSAINISASANNTAICAGFASTLTANGTGGTGTITYTWVAGATSNVNTVSPTSTSVYTVNASDDNNCPGTSTVEVTVNSLPTIIVNSGAVCVGNSFTMTPNGAVTYTYSNGSDVVMPLVDASYTVTGTDGNGCVSSVGAVSSVTVNALPTVSVNSGSICIGESFTMTPTGTDAYTYSNGNDVAMPTADATYTVTGTNTVTGCSNMAVSSVTVNALPTVSAVTNNTLICTSETATLTVSGTATSYTWSTTENAMDIVVSPTVQTTYTVDGTDANGCVNSTTIMQDVSLCTGVNQIASVTNELMVYPNPSNGTFNINVTTLTKVTVLDVLGKVVYAESFEAGKNQIDLHQQADGVYFLKEESNGSTKTIRLIKK